MMAISSTRGIHPSPLLSRIPIRINNGNHVFPHRRACVLRHASLPGNGQIPALRPSHPHGCRKWAFRQDQTLSGRFAGLDVHALASGLIHLRSTDEEASGGARSKEVRRPKAQRHKKAFPAPHDFPAYRHTAKTLYANLSRRMLHRVFPIHKRCPLSGVQMPAPSCASF